jgi:hypothetical protein
MPNFGMVGGGGSTAGSRSYRNHSPEQLKKQRCGLLLAALFILVVIVAVSVTVSQIYQSPSANDSMPTPPPIRDVSPPTAPVAADSVESTSQPTNAPTVTGYQACNGYESLCDVPANNVLYATLHNAVATQEDGFSVFPNHELQLETALQAGWRGLNFDVGKCSELFTDQPLRLVHGFCSLTRDPVEVFTNILSFLQNNPNEVLLMPLEIDNDLDGGSVSYNEVYALMGQVSGWTDMLYQHPGVGTAWPTLRELIAVNTRILLFFYGGATSCAASTDCPPGFHDWFTYAAETAFEFASITDIEATDTSCEITRGGQGERDFFGINLFTTIPSTTVAEQINMASFVQQHIENCTTLNALQPTLILVDYWNIGDVQSVVSFFNQQLAGTTRQLTANVTMNVVGSFATTMNDTEQVTFLASCSDYFAAQITNLSNVYCSDTLDQSLVLSSRRRLQQRQLNTPLPVVHRSVQTTTSSSSILQVTVQVQGGDTSDTTSTSAATPITTSQLENVLATTSTSLVQSLSVQSDYFSTVTEITTVTSDDAAAGDGNTTDAPTNTPSLEQTMESAEPSTSVPSSPARTTLMPTMFPSSISAVVISPKSTAPLAVPVIIPTADTTQLCNGHANLCDIPVNDVLFATVHNAASTVADGVFAFPNHEKSLEDALIAGYRGINVDIGKCDGVVRLVHGFCALGFRDILETLTNIVTFLETNVNEVIILPIQINNDTGGIVTLQEIDMVLQQVPGMKELMYNHPVPTGTTARIPWPTLRELIASNTRILFFVYNGERCYGSSATVSCPTGIHDWFQYAGESEFQFTTTSQFMDDKAYACAITRGATGLLDFYGVNVFLTIPSSSACEILNTQENLVSHLSACTNVTGQAVVNLLIVDCWDIGDVLTVVSTYNANL